MNTRTLQTRSFRDDLQKNLISSPTLKDLLTNNVRLSHEQFVAKAIGTVMGSEDLQKCSIASILRCCLKSAQLGLPVDANGYAHLIARKGQCVFEVGSKGYIELIKRNSDVMSCIVESVYVGDSFKYYIDERGQHLEHIPMIDMVNREIEDGLRCVYAIVCYKSGGAEIAVMNNETIRKIKTCASTDYIWKNWHTEKAKTAVIKRLGKRTVRMNVDIALELDEEDVTQAPINNLTDINTLIEEMPREVEISGHVNDTEIIL